MAGFRQWKALFRGISATGRWKSSLEAELRSPEKAQEAVSPLLALLPDPDTRWQAVYGLGLAVPLMARNSPEKGRIFLRRLLWSMNEDSGNIGWGIPEAMGAILANSPALAGEYARILLSYAYRTGKADNYVEHPPLRRGVYWGIGRLAAGNAAQAMPALPHLAAALEGEEDPRARGMAAWALRQLAEQKGGGAERSGDWRAAALRKGLLEARDDMSTEIELLDGSRIRRVTLAALYKQALDAVPERTRP